MTVLAVLLVLAICGLLGYFIWRSSESPAAPPPDPETVQKAAVELHRIRRRLEAADLKQHQRRDATRFKREIAEVLDDRPEFPK